MTIIEYAFQMPDPTSDPDNVLTIQYCGGKVMFSSEYTPSFTAIKQAVDHLAKVLEVGNAF